MLPDINKERYIFVLPTSKGTLVGTTEVSINHPNDHSVNKFEEDYLIESINNYFVKKFSRLFSLNIKFSIAIVIHNVL